jgi:hypothetical protein
VTYGEICGAVFVGSDGKTKRCYAKGYARYGGRCSVHEQLGEECQKSRRGPRCGYRGRTWSGMPCAAMVARDGQRCARHGKQGLADAAGRYREELRQRIADVEGKREKLDDKLKALRSELQRVVARDGVEEAAE